KMKIAEEGAVQLIAELVYEEDENQLNNRRIVSIYVYDKPVNYNDIIINEIMFAPTNDEPEWVELQNISDKRINLKNWKIADNSSSVIITTKDFFLLPNEFLVICGDSSLFSFHQVNSKFIIKSMPAFNNNGDDVVIKESYGFTIDSLKYDASWIKPVGGRSLERFSSSVSTINNSNWNLSVASTKGTPGIINSITKKDYDLSISKVETIPRIPIVDEEFQIKVTLKNIGYKNSKEYTLQIYFDANRDSVSQSNERIYTNSQSQIAINDSLSFVIPYKIYEERSCQIIVDLIYEEDQNQLNNKVYLTFEVKEKPVNINSIIINEVMFAPTNDEPE
ncbi:MAG: lamin tail domain-containing protein, partial [Ignavibacteria bacterium]|nr:lamin tail domain-containing protein [Ignavibacteria bacterium]